VPVVDADRSQTRKATAAAISLGNTWRPSGMERLTSARASSALFAGSLSCSSSRCVRSVAVMPGDTALMRTLCGASSLEAFANEVVDQAYRLGYVYPDPNPRTGQPFTIEEIERTMPIETKLCGALPTITKTRSPKGTALWQRFGHLRKIRHIIVHPKPAQLVQTSPDVNRAWKLLTDASFRNFAIDAKALMMHYCAEGAHAARWLHKCPF